MKGRKNCYLIKKIICSIISIEKIYHKELSSISTQIKKSFPKGLRTRYLGYEIVAEANSQFMLARWI